MLTQNMLPSVKNQYLCDLGVSTLRLLSFLLSFLHYQYSKHDFFKRLGPNVIIS